MARHVNTHACTCMLLLLSLLHVLCMAYGRLDLPRVVRVHAGQKSHILCVYTCTYTVHGEAESCNVQLDWNDRPPEFLSLEGYYNTTHHSLKMNVEAGSQDTDTYRYITCVAKTTDGYVIEERSTRLEICPAETLRCRFDMELHQAPNIVSYMFACEYKSKCGTKMHCQSNREGLSSRYLGFHKTGPWKVEKYKIVGLMPGDNVTCRLLAPSIEQHLQTTVELMLPEESSPEQTTQVPKTQAITMQMLDTETKTYSICLPTWVLGILFAIILIAPTGIIICVRFVYKKYCKNCTALPCKYKDTCKRPLRSGDNQHDQSGFDNSCSTLPNANKYSSRRVNTFP